MKVDFYLRFQTRFGQQLSITGNFGTDDEPQTLPLQYFNEEYWHISVAVTKAAAPLQYRYMFTKEDGEEIKDGEKCRTLPLNITTDMVVLDTWNDGGAFGNVFYTAPFKQVLLSHKSKNKEKKKGSYTHLFKVKAPLLKENEVVCLLGDSEPLQSWDTTEPVRLENDGDWWVASLNFKETDLPAGYKYGVYNTSKKEFVQFESGPNRKLPLSNSDTVTIVHDGFVQLPNNTWKGAGVAIPVFSLKSEKSFGIGEFADLKLLADWAALTGIKLIQILPVNDTTATATWEDSYPYAAISAFALHPLYINLQKVGGKKWAKTVQAFSKKQKGLNNLPHVDYEKVLQFKMAALGELYELQGTDFLSDKEYKQFFEENKHWLVPYAAFCFLRDRAGTADFSKWKNYQVYNHFEIEKLGSSKNRSAKGIRFYYFLQYHLHLQLKEAVDYAHKKGVVIKGDIPIGIYRNGCDAWTAPELYNLDQHAGAPPDDFAVKGQNWGFPTYNWQRMQKDNFDWWRKRFQQMSLYFDAFRIDHILGFFRIWSIPEHAVEGILGQFVPAIPVTASEFGARGIYFNYDRFCKPYITDAVLYQYFGEGAEAIKQTFLNAHEHGSYNLKEEFNTQQKVAKYFEGQEVCADNKKMMEGLFDLISNVILLEPAQPNGNDFHFRISVDKTTSFQHLDEHTKYHLKELYIDYFYRRQDHFWKEEALRKLPALKDATDMLVCGEDLGMVPQTVPEVMSRLGILSLEIQRMPKNLSVEFFDPKDAPYLSVITPSTHDMSTVRGWWEEDRAKTQRFYNNVLGQSGEAPPFCEAWINRAIVMQHLYAPAMWSIFQMQDILAMSETLRRENPHEERINVPAVPKHYWQYRMHITLEQLLKETDFNKELKDYVTNSGRAYVS